MQKPLKFRIEFLNSRWYIVDPDNASNHVPIDTALMDVTFFRPGVVEGYVVAVHGLDMEIASTLDVQVLRALGATGPTHQRAPGPKTRRGQLTDKVGVDWTRL